MCELLAMSTEFPTNLNLSLHELAEHSSTGGHVDGWGIAYYSDHDARRIRDTRPAYESPWAHFVAAQGLVSRLVIAHIRKATQGTVTLANTQPFERELGGHVHVFAHNGHLPGVPAVEAYRSRHFRPIGTTDSEYVFCYLLELLYEAWRGDEPPSFDRRWQIFRDVCAEFRDQGPANFLYSDGDYLFAHGNQRTQEDGTRRAPGLHWLCRECSRQSGASLEGPAFSVTGTDAGKDAIQRVVLVASVPLTDEPWEAMAAGETIAAHGGQIVARDVPAVC